MGQGVTINIDTALECYYRSIWQGQQKVIKNIYDLYLDGYCFSKNKTENGFKNKNKNKNKKVLIKEDATTGERMKRECKTTLERDENEKEFRLEIATKTAFLKEESIEMKKKLEAALDAVTKFASEIEDLEREAIDK
ncbi:hypothetical protein K501DRAFT_305995 [Backusella circina FSU 941]|nr:hypothetical protein K501DRAFT_305995 [Backusella circina FSU 941]